MKIQIQQTTPSYNHGVCHLQCHKDGVCHLQYEGEKEKMLRGSLTLKKAYGDSSKGQTDINSDR
jgi:hypothetical protein